MHKVRKLEFTRENTASPLGKAPALPYHYVQRVEPEAQIQNHLLHCLDNNAKSYITITGMGGIGKTTLAIAVARGTRVASHFSDGVFWMSGKSAAKSNHVDLLRDVYKDVMKKVSRSSVVNARGRRAWRDENYVRAINVALIGRRCLLIIDDLAEANTLGTMIKLQLSLLVTSQSRHLFHDGPKFEDFSITALSSSESHQLLRHVLGSTAVDHESLKKIMEASAGHPLALSIMGTLCSETESLTNRNGIQALLARLQDPRSKLTMQTRSCDIFYPEDRTRHLTLSRCLDHPLTYLSRTERGCYIDLAALDYDAEATVTILQSVWGTRDEDETHKIVRALEGRCLVHSSRPRDAVHNFGSGTWGMHRLQHDHLKALAAAQMLPTPLPYSVGQTVVSA